MNGLSENEIHELEVQLDDMVDEGDIISSRGSIDVNELIAEIEVDIYYKRDSKKMLEYYDRILKAKQAIISRRKR